MLKRGIFVLIACFPAACVVKTESVEGLSCWDLDGDGIEDAAEDVNNDGLWDARDCAGPRGDTGVNGNPGTPGGTGIPCWDLDADGLNDAAEDVNSDGLWDARDCIGPQGLPGDIQWSPCTGGICYGGGDVTILDGELLLPGSSGSVRAANGDVLILRGSQLPSDGGRIDLHGASHPTSPDLIKFLTLGLERMRITSAGDVGIGTAAPTDRLHIGQGGSIRLDAAGAVNPQDFRFSVGGPTPSYDTLYIQAENASGSESFDDLVAIRASGKVGIGTTVPQERLDVAGSIQATGPGSRLVLASTVVGGQQYEWYNDDPSTGSMSLYNRTSDNYSISVAPDGNVGIGATSPKAKLDVAGGIKSTLPAYNGFTIARARPYSTYLVTISGNYDVGNAVRSGVYHVVLNYEGTAVAFQTAVSVINGQTATFSVVNGDVIVYGLPAGDAKASVVEN